MAVSIADLAIRVDASQLRQAQAETQRLTQAGRDAESSVNRMSSAWAKFGGILGGISFAVLARDILATNRQFESLRMQLDGVFGSASAGALAFKEAMALSVNTPFELKDITQAFITLKNFGIDPTISTMDALTNQAARLGKGAQGLTTLTMQLGQAWTKGKLQMQDMHIMMEAGVPIIDMLKTVTGKTGAEIAKMSESGELGRDTIKRLIDEMGRLTAGSNAAAMETLNGKISNLSDAWHNFEDTLLGDKSEGLIKNIVTSITNSINLVTRNMSDQIDSQLARSQARINTFKSMGAVGSFIGDMMGYDINSEKNKLDSLKKLKQKQDEADQEIKINQSRAEAIKETNDWLNEMTATDSEAAEKRAKNAAKRGATEAESAAKKAIKDAEQHQKAIKDLLVSLADQQYQMDLVSKGKVLEAEISKNLMSVMRDEIMAGGELSEANKVAKDEITEQTTAIYNKTEALRIQQAMWDESVRQANELYDINKAAIDLQETSRMAESLHLMGATNEEIKKRIDLEKQLVDAVKAHPDQDPQVVRDSVIAQQRASDEIAKYTDLKTSESAKWMEKAFEQAARNIQDSFASMFESMLNGDATASFAKFAENIRKTLNKAISQQLALDLQGLFSENGSIMNVLKSGLLFLVASIPSFFGKKQDSRQLSPAEVGNSSVLGTGAMHIADSFSRDLGYEYQNQAIIRFNRSLDSLALGLMTGIKAGFENFSTQISEFGTKIIQLPIVNSVVEFMKPVTEIISKAYNAISEMIGKGVSFITDSISSITNSISNIFSSTTDVATTAASKATETSASIIKSAGTVIAVIGAIYSAFTYFSGLGDMLDRGNIGEIVGSSMQLAGSIIAAGAMIASSGIGVIVGAVVAIVGALVSLFTSSTRVPNAWMNTYNPDNSGNPLQNNSGLGTYNADVGKSAYVGEYTPFGVTVISTHEANLSIDQMNNAFGELLKTVKTVDINLYNTVNRLDDAFGQAGKTMDYYNRTVVGNNRVATKNNLSDLDTGNMLSQRYAWIVDILGNSGSIVGQYINAWFDVITNKFITVSQSNSMFVLGVIDSVSANIESFMQFPLGLVNLIGQSVKATNMGGTPDSVMAEISGVFDTYLQVQSGLKQLGMGGDQGAINESIVRFLADVNGIGFAVKDAGINLLAYAIAMQKANGGMVDALYVLNDANSKLMSLKSQGLDNSQITAYIGSFGLMANLFSEAKVTFTSADLASAAQNIHNLSQASVNVARNTVDHAIANEKLTNVTRESAIATLVKNKTLDEATVAESEYGVSIAKVTKEMLSNLAFIQQIGFTAGQSLGDMGISAGVWQKAASNIVNVFGDLETAMKTWDSIAKAFMSSTDYAKYNLDTINRSLANMAAVNPNLAQWFTPENIAASLKSGQSMADYINILASGNGELAKESFSYIDLVMKRIEAEKSLQSAMQDIMQTYKDIESWLNKDKRGSASGTNDFARNTEYWSQLGDLYGKAMSGDTASVSPLLSLVDEYKGFLEKYSPATFAKVSEDIRGYIVALQDKVGIDTGALPSHANGLDSVPYDGYVAKLHQGERVLTASESRNYSAKDDKETIAMLVELIRTEREGFKQVINELRIANKNTSEVKASARRAEVKA